MLYYRLTFNQRSQQTRHNVNVAGEKCGSWEYAICHFLTIASWNGWWLLINNHIKIKVCARWDCADWRLFCSFCVKWWLKCKTTAKVAILTYVFNLYMCFSSFGSFELSGVSVINCVNSLKPVFCFPCLVRCTVACGMLCQQCAAPRECWHFTAVCLQCCSRFSRTLGCSSSPTTSSKSCWFRLQRLDTRVVSGAHL